MSKFELKNHVFPLPKEYEELGQVKIGTFSKAHISLITDDSGELIDSAKDVIEKALLGTAASKICDGGYPVTLSIDKSGKTPEGYTVEVTETGATVKGHDPAGVFYGAITLSKLIFVSGDEVFLDKVTIKDAPAVGTRCAFIESRHNEFHTLEEWYEIIDYYADLKINKVNIAIYGCWRTQFDGMPAEYLYVPIKGHPELKTPKKIKYYSARESRWVYEEGVLPTIFEEDYLDSIIKYGKKKNVEVYPLFNSFGHNSLFPRVMRDLSAKDEDGNPTLHGFCTSNPKTKEFLFSAYDYIIDKYLTPNGIKSFAIGMDEVQPYPGFDPSHIYKYCDPICRCESCRSRTKEDIMIEWTIDIIKHLKSRGMTSVYFFHDIFFEHNMINEDMVKRFKDEDIFDVAVIDWWTYLAGSSLMRGRAAEVTGLFRSTIKPWNGYNHWSHYSVAWPNIYDATELGEKLGFEGMTYYTSFDYGFDFTNRYYAECCWAMAPKSPDEVKARYFASEYPDYPLEAHEEWDKFEEVANHYYERGGIPEMIGMTTYAPHTFLMLPLKGYDDTIPYPRLFAEEVGRNIDADRARYMQSFRKRLSRCNDFLEFLNSDKANPSRTNEFMKLAADNQRVITDFYYTLYRLTENIGSGECNNAYAISEIKRLIRGVDGHIYLIESLKFKTFHPTSARLLSKLKLYLNEVLAEFEAADARGELYRYDIRQGQKKSSGFEFIG